jgi:hypothetical protein
VFLRKPASKQALDSLTEGWFIDALNRVVWVKFATSSAAASKIILNNLNAGL